MSCFSRYGLVYLPRVLKQICSLSPQFIMFIFSYFSLLFGGGGGRGGGCTQEVY